jgi:hypothetical protein
MERVLFGKKRGWALFEADMERHIEKGICSDEEYRKHLNGEGSDPRTMDSLLHYQRWVDEHPGEDIPEHILRIRTDRQHAEWLEQGCPTIDKEKFRCSRCNAYFDPPEQRKLFS